MANNKSKYTAEQLLDRAFVWLIRQPQFVALSPVLMVGDSLVVDDIPFTASTDGYNVYYSRKFIDSLETEEEVRAVVLHENYHKAFRHVATWGHLNKACPACANVAADYVVNATIQNAGCEGVKLPKHALYDKKYSDSSVGEIFKTIHRQNQQQQQQNGNGSGSGQPGEDEGQGGQCKENREDGDEHQWDKAQEMSAEEQRAQAEAIDSAIRQGAILAGKVGGTLDRALGEMIKVKTDWRESMRQFFTDTCIGEGELSYRRPNRRFLHEDMIFPVEVCETLPFIFTGIDTSGSISGEVITEFLSHKLAMLSQINPEKVAIAYWDTRVAGYEEYDREKFDMLIASTKPKGGGGTSPSCVAKFIKDKKLSPTCVVMLTDGYVDSWPTFDCPVLWCIKDNPGACPPEGIVIHLED